jgi:DNA ligase-1
MENQQQELFSKLKKADYLIKTFTRNLEDSTHQHPDIVNSAMTQIKADSVILDGEAVGIDKDTGEFLPFQQIMQRKRKHGVKEMASEIPLVYFVFDILYKNGESLVKKPLETRHKALIETINENETIKVAEYLKTKDVDELSDYFNEAKDHNLEGLVVKKPEDPYQAGARSYSWVKLKMADEKLLEDSLDVVVLGYFFGKGERSKLGIGKFLAGIYDQDSQTFKTITKVGTGLTEDDWKKMKKLSDKHRVSKVPKNVEITKNYQPDVYTAPEIVVEIGGDEISVSKTHSSGYALRFPRLLHFRPDKDSDQATTIEEVKNLHSLQKRGHYKNEKGVKKKK